MLEIVNFYKKYSKVQILNNVNISFNENEITFLMGQNGSGKTTLIKCMMGLENFSGTITLDNKNISKEGERCLAIWDDCPFYTEISGLKNLYILGEGKCSKKQIQKYAARYLDLDKLKRKVKTYSYGQKKKLALSLVCILEPKVIIMDEISNGLDYETMMMLKKELLEMARTKIIILTGHQFSFYNDIIDKLLLIKEKNIVEVEGDFKSGLNSLEDIYEKELYN